MSRVSKHHQDQCVIDCYLTNISDGTSYRFCSAERSAAVKAVENYFGISYTHRYSGSENWLL